VDPCARRLRRAVFLHFRLASGVIEDRCLVGRSDVTWPIAEPTSLTFTSWRARVSAVKAATLSFCVTWATRYSGRNAPYVSRERLLVANRGEVIGSIEHQELV